MKKFDLPKRPEIPRKYTAGARKVISVRLPESLIKRLNKEVKEKGYSQTEIIEIVLDQYFQSGDE